MMRSLVESLRLTAALVLAAAAEAAESLSHSLEELSRRVDPMTVPVIRLEEGFTKADYSLARAILAVTPPTCTHGRTPQSCHECRAVLLTNPT